MLIPKIHKIDPEDPDADLIQEAAGIVKNGGVVAFPTRCLYGLGVDAFNPNAVERIFKIKQRPTQKPILILIESPERLERLVARISSSASIVRRFGEWIISIG